MTSNIDNFFAWPDLICAGSRKALFWRRLHTLSTFSLNKAAPRTAVRSSGKQLSDQVVFDGIWKLATSTTLVARSPCAYQIQGGDKYYLGVQILFADQIHSSQFLYQIHLAGQTHFDHFSYQIQLADQIHSAGQDPWSKSRDWSTPAVLDHQAVRAT